MLFSASLLSACSTSYSSTPKAALLSSSNQTSHDALTLAVSKVVGSKVTLAPDSFMVKSFITIEPPSVNKRNGHIINGRSMEMPSHIDLIKLGQTCYVVNRETGKKYAVKGLKCKLAPET